MAHLMYSQISLGIDEEARKCCAAQVLDPLQPGKTEFSSCRLKVPPFPPASLSDLDVHVHWCGHELPEHRSELGGPV